MLAPDDVAARRTAGALGCVLALLALLRLLAPLPRTMWPWALNAPRFLAPPAAWIPLLLAAVALLPWLARPVLRALLWAGRPLAGRPALTAVLAALGAAALVGSLPDRLYFVGDFVLRRGILNTTNDAASFFPQALPLEVFLHVSLPRAMLSAWGLDADAAARLIGVVDAALLALLSVGFVRAARLGGGPGLAAGAIVFFGGYLAGMTGYGKIFPELALLAVAAGICSLWDETDGRGLLGLAACTALGLCLHRSALVLLPTLGWAWFEQLHGEGRGSWRRRPVQIAAALSVLALALLPGLAGIMADRRDVMHLALPEIARAGLLRATFAGVRSADLANLLLLISPLAVAIPVLLVVGGRPLLARRPTRMLCALALPMFAAVLLVHPGQGIFRDWDDFFMFGAGLSALAAWLVGRTLQDRPLANWLAVAAILAVAGPTVQWLQLNGDLERGLEHTRAIVLEPPARTAEEQAVTWSFIGQRDAERGRWERAAGDYEQAARFAPSPRLLTEWGLALQHQGQLEEARRRYERAVQQKPTFTPGWMGIGACSVRLGDTAGAGRALRELQRLDPGNPEIAELSRFLSGGPASPAE